MSEALSRRDFLQVTAGAGAFVTLAPPAAGDAASPGFQAQDGLLDGWFDRPMRWVQLTLVENDPGRFDPQFWLDYFKRLHADAACLSAGGIVAYYPTDVPLHHRSAWLGDTDPFGTLVDRLPRDGHERHREDRSARRARRSQGRASRLDHRSRADGQPRRHWANPDLWVTLRARPLQLRLHGPGAPGDRQPLYKVDGIFVEPLGAAGRDCFCTHCQENFKAATGQELPRTPIGSDRAPAFLEWRNARLTELWKKWDATVRAANPGARFIPNGPPDLKTRGRAGADPVHRQPGAPRRDAAVGERPARQGIPVGDGPAADRRHLQRRPRRGLPVEGLRAERAGDPALGRGGDGERHASVGDEVLAACSTTSAGSPSSNGSTTGTRGTSSTFATRCRWRAWRCSSPNRRPPITPVSRRAIGTPITCSACTTRSSRIAVPFEMAHEALLTPERLDRFKLLILADAAALSDAQCAAIRAYVERGGSVLATFATSLYDEQGRQREGFRLAELLACLVRRPHRRADAELVSEPGRRSATGARHPVLDGLHDTPRIINGVFRVNVTPKVPFPSPVTLIPTYPDLPMEDVYPRVAHTDTRELYLREIGRSRVAYVPWDIDRTFWDVMCVDHCRLLRTRGLGRRTSRRRPR